MWEVYKHCARTSGMGSRVSRPSLEIRAQWVTRRMLAGGGLLPVPEVRGAGERRHAQLRRDPRLPARRHRAGLRGRLRRARARLAARRRACAGPAAAPLAAPAPAPAAAFSHPAAVTLCRPASRRSWFAGASTGLASFSKRDSELFYFPVCIEPASIEFSLSYFDENESNSSGLSAAASTS